jgi:hypothetical protein
MIEANTNAIRLIKLSDYQNGAVSNQLTDSGRVHLAECVGGDDSESVDL